MRLVVRTDANDDTVGNRLSQSLTVALCPQGGADMGVTIEIHNVMFRKKQLMCCDICGDRKSALLRPGNHVN